MFNNTFMRVSKIYRFVFAMGLLIPSISLAAEKAPAEGDTSPTLIITNRPFGEVVTDRPQAIAPSIQPQLDDPIPASQRMRPVAPVSMIMPKVETDSSEAPLEDYFAEVETATTRRIEQLRSEYLTLQDDLNELADQIRMMQIDGRERSADYYSSIAQIQTELQAGSPPGNPRLIAKLKSAQDKLEQLSASLSKFNSLAVKVGDISSVTSYLIQSVQATYGLSGAVKEDHERLEKLEDSISSMVVVIERLLNTINEEITRASGYLAAERSNMRTMALAVANGDVYGANLSNRLYSQSNQSFFPVSLTPGDEGTAPSIMSNNNAPQKLSPNEPQPLMIIRFDGSAIEYEQALYTAVSEAKDKYPAAKFEVIAVDPGTGNAAKRAIEAAKAKRNAERVLRSMVQMGVNANEVVLSNASREAARSSEVHVLLR